MIKIFGFSHPEYQEATKEEIFAYFKDKEYIQFDTETTGFSCHNDKLVCIQMGDFDNQYVIHPNKLLEFKAPLERRTLIFHNAKFDLNFLYKNNIWPNKVYDTFLAEGVLHCGIPSEKKNLAHIAKKRLGIDINKSVREANIGKQGLTADVIDYAANDVKYLEKLMWSQEADLAMEGLKKALELENQFVLTLAFIEFCGFKLDGEKWYKKHIDDIKKSKECLKVLNNWVINQNITQFINSQLDMFSTEISTTINWNSPKQVIPLFQHLKIPVEIIEKGQKKLTVDATHISKYAKKFEIIPLYIAYKEAEKVVGTYGTTFIDQINASTGRLQTNFRQIMDTSRISSGGKDKVNKTSYINFQNIPKEKETRECFIPEKYNKLVIGDFSGQESIVLTNISLDESLIEFYESGVGDMHSFVASKMYKELNGLSVNEIKEHHSEKRYNAKTAGFAINYGGVGSTIAANSEDGISVEEGDEIYNAYFEAFPGLKKYFDKAKKEGLQKGYILISPLTGRKSYIFGWREYLELNKKMDRKFWDRWKWLKLREPGSDECLAMKAQISKYFQIKGEIERKSLNYPIQGQSAEISKLAGILLFNWIKENKYQNKVLIANAIHDEYVLDVPEELAEECKKQLKFCMEEAGKPYCQRIPLKADVKIAANWGEK
jgi:DNA polymerase I-like protein with 3'-5' exonuclease and polymerase domains